MARRDVAIAVVAGAVGVFYSYFAGGTKPFTDSADVMTAVPFAVMGAVMVSSLLRRRRRGITRLPKSVAPGGDVRMWVLTIGITAAWELATYFAGFSAGRHAFPTISSLADEAYRWRSVKAALFACWLGLGWGLVRR